MSKCLTIAAFSMSIALLAGAPAESAVINQYTFTGGSLAASSVDPDVTAGNVTGSPTVNGQPTSVLTTPTGVGYASQPFLAAARSSVSESGTRSNVYFTFTVTADPGTALNLSSLDFNVAQGGGTVNTRDYDIRTSADIFATSLTGITLIPTLRPTFTPVSVSLGAPAFQNLNALTVQVRFFTPGVSQNVDFDDIVLNGVVVPEPTTAALLLGGLGLLRRSRARA